MRYSTKINERSRSFCYCVHDQLEMERESPCTGINLFNASHRAAKAHFISSTVYIEWLLSYIMHMGLLRSAHHLIFMLFAQLRRVSNFHDAIHTQSTPLCRSRRTTNFHFALHALFERIFALRKYFDMCMRAAAAAAPGSLLMMGCPSSKTKTTHG